jgi:hypothetical protein
VSKDKEKKRGRISKTLPTIPAQEVDIPLVVGSASCSPLTGGINANDSSIGPSIGMSSYDDATIGDNTMPRNTNDEPIWMLDDNDANELVMVVHQMLRVKDTNVLFLLKMEWKRWSSSTCVVMW